MSVSDPKMKPAKHPCKGEPTASGTTGASRRPLAVKRVDECETLDELFQHCLPSFGGAYLRRIYTLLDAAIGSGYPLTIAVAGPVTVSGQHYTWLIPLLETGWVSYISTTDAICYHDGHRALDGMQAGPFFEVPIFGDDGALRDEGTIRVTDVGFDEEVLFDQDRFLSAVLLQPEFQKEMTGTELRYLLGKYYAAQEEKNKIRPGLLATCHRLSLPVLVGAPADGSIFLNSMKLWAMQQTGMIDDYRFRLDLHAEVLEACAYHRWGLFDHPKKGLATLILGGGVAKNYNLQPEPALSQVLGIKDVRGYSFDVQIVSAPVTDGSLSSCAPAEAVTWGKVDRDVYDKTTESMQCDFSIVMPFVVKALLDNRARYERWAAKMGQDALFEAHPKAQGYLRSTNGYRLFGEREALVEKLKGDIRANKGWLLDSLKYALATHS